MKPNFPFVAVAGQLEFKLALILAAINPSIGGVLISGPRGCAKSTLAKALADVLPRAEGVLPPFVTIPLGASEEMLIGTLDLQKVLDQKNVSFQPGLLAKAHGGVLYVDEVNLLGDNLVDQLLDVSASGINIIERDGISHSHAADFTLLGTMNPDEGELRSQLQDRFGLSVELSNQYTLDERIAIVELREHFDTNPAAFIASYAKQQAQLVVQITDAKQLLGSTVLPSDMRRVIAERCQAAFVDGLRADIVWSQAAAAHAAFHQRTAVNAADIDAVEHLVLNHRRNASPPRNDSSTPHAPEKPFSRPQEKQEKNTDGDWGAMNAQQQKTQEVAEVSFLVPQNSAEKKGKNDSLVTANKNKGFSAGRFRDKSFSRKIHWFSTLLSNAGAWPLTQLHYQKNTTGNTVLNIVLLDTSGSILSNSSFAKAKGLIVQVAKQAYVNREQIAIVGFGNEKVETLLGRRRSPKAIHAFLDDIVASGGTPFAAALKHASDFQQGQLRKSAGIEFNTYIITDGRVSKVPESVSLQGNIVLLDVEQAAVKRGRAKAIADTLGAQYFALQA